MNELSDLVYVKYAPYRQMLQIIQTKEGSNHEDIRIGLKSLHKIDMGLWKLKKILFSMESKGIIVRINNNFFMSDMWILGIGEFLKGYTYMLQDPFLASLLREANLIKNAQI